MITKIDFKAVTKTGKAYRKKIYSFAEAFNNWPKGKIFSKKNLPPRRPEVLDYPGDGCAILTDPAHKTTKQCITDLLEAGELSSLHEEALYHFQAEQRDNGFVDPLASPDRDLIDIHKAREKYNKAVSEIMEKRAKEKEEERKKAIIAEADRLRALEQMKNETPPALEEGGIDE